MQLWQDIVKGKYYSRSLGWSPRIDRNLCSLHNQERGKVGTECTCCLRKDLGSRSADNKGIYIIDKNIYARDIIALNQLHHPTHELR
ncbi:uncharacterized protein LAJ45_03949 [Morchella importuna]|uniref:uncharacterized protein n=1 Tax=Morchella importuna TaxID=1174673 RepID=UPI001E8DC0F0|nr:uncharacterized protein LAJ45_03949 [Morchella importuna]KAH8151956.1 hypothetical protein LAJ45_03949 [Morchella importuna]